MKSPSSKVIDAIISSGPRQFLKDQGFRKMARSFVKEVGGLYWIINFQSSMWNSPESARFTINVMLVLPFLHEVWTPHPLPANPASAASLCSFRIGLLMPEKKDHWWEVDPTTNAEAVGIELVEALRGYALPALSQASDLEWIVEQLLDKKHFSGCMMNQSLAAAILLVYLDRESEARRIIDELKKDNPGRGFGGTVRTIEQRLKAKGKLVS